jgi:hypothetical protein
MTRMLVRSWHETYRGLMPDRVLDDPGLVKAREGSGPLLSSTSAIVRTASRRPAPGPGSPAAAARRSR